MQKSPLASPLLDFAVALTEAQLKYWQALQVEGAAFVAKRMRAHLAYLRALSHCTDPKAICDCHLAWFSDARKDYGEEWARLAGTLFSLGVSEIAPMGAGFTRPRARASNGLAPATDGPRDSVSP